MKRPAPIVFLFVAVVRAASVAAQPTLTTVTPAGGLTAGGEYVHIHGTNLIGPPLACPAITCSTYVKFGEVFATIVDNTAGELVVIAPPHAADPVDLEVNIPGAPPVAIFAGYQYEQPATSETVRLLVPVAISAAGALGTNWRTEFLLNNANAEGVTLGGAVTPPGGAAPTIAAFATAAVPLYPPPGNTGAFVYVPRRLAANVTASLRVHDTTRDADSWGTDVPVVLETQFRRVLILPGVPADARFRTLLRIYGYNGSDTPVRIDLRDDASGALLLTRTALLQSGVTTSSSVAPIAPAYSQIPLDSLLAPSSSAHPVIRVEVTSTSAPPPPLWGFVAITNNTTQQATTITPGASHPVRSTADGTAGLAAGHWGGADACVDVDATQVVIRTSCAISFFALPLLAADGSFSGDGTYQPIPGAGPADPVPAHFSGSVNGTTLTLTIRTARDNIGPATVKLGVQGPCPGGCA